MPDPLEVDEQASGKTVVLAAGQTLVVRLPERPATGYLWTVESSGLMRVADSEFFPAGMGVGASGTRQLRLTAESSGRTEIALALRRAWEHKSEASKHFNLTVVSD
jgi:predicted secreted protein